MAMRYNGKFCRYFREICFQFFFLFFSFWQACECDTWRWRSHFVTTRQSQWWWRLVAGGISPFVVGVLELQCSFWPTYPWSSDFIRNIIPLLLSFITNYHVLNLWLKHTYHYCYHIVIEENRGGYIIMIQGPKINRRNQHTYGTAQEWTTLSDGHKNHLI